MTAALEKTARVIDPLAWAALGAGDTAAFAHRRTASLRKANHALNSLLPPSPEMVEAMEKGANERASMVDRGWIDTADLEAAFTAAIASITEGEG